jgi:diguanylate cyclase (GGDEF)-like protein
MYSGIANQFRHASLLAALIVIVLLTFSASLIGYHYLQRQAKEHLYSVADLTAVQAQAAVLFKDKQDATELLQAVPDSSGIQHMELRDDRGNMLAEYSHQPGALASIASWLGTQTVSHDVVADGRMIGRLTLVGSNEPLIEALLRLILSDIVIAALIITLLTLLTAYYTRRITQPMDRLRELMRTIIDRGDFSRRAPASALIEVEELRLEFNALLDEIMRRDGELKQASVALSRMAFYDVLTGLPNRAMFEQALERAVRNSDADGTPIALLYADVDDFKGINDYYGHAAGDHFLIVLGQRLEEWRPADALVARMGGDEFVVLIAPFPEKQDIVELAAQLRAVIETPFRLDSHLICPSLSVGIALYPETPASDLVRAADRSMYTEKMRRLGARWRSSTTLLGTLPEMGEPL